MRGVNVPRSADVATAERQYRVLQGEECPECGPHGDVQHRVRETGIRYVCKRCHCAWLVSFDREDDE